MVWPYVVGAALGLLGVLSSASKIEKEVEEWKKLLKEIKHNKEDEHLSKICDIKDIDIMSGEEFENFLACKFKTQGYQVFKTATTQDYGADIILEKEGERIVIQAKRWSNNVGVKAIQEITAARSYYKANKGLVITNSRFTKNAYELASANTVTLWDRTLLMKFLINNISVHS